MIASKAGSLVTGLYTGTEAGRLDWRKTDIEGTYQLTLPEHAIQITEELRSSQLETCVQISLFDKAGELIDRFTDEDFGTETANARGFAIMMGNLYRRARGYALGLEQAYDAVLKEIADPDVPF